MTRFSDEAWQRIAALRHAVHNLPFNIELAAGSLSRDRFQAYITQDAI
jgi:thiaminase/transcriptional activator TenA